MPSPNSFPVSVWRAFERRQRTLHLLDAEHESQLVPDCVDGNDFYRCEIAIQLRVDGRSVILHAHVWPDRWAWIDARHSVHGGWRWQFTTQGRLVDAGGARAFVANVEKMLRTAQRPASEVPDAMHAIWDATLLSGARRIA